MTLHSRHPFDHNSHNHNHHKPHQRTKSTIESSTNDNDNNTIEQVPTRPKRRKRKEIGTPGSAKYSRREIANYKAHENVKLTPFQNALSVLALLCAVLGIFYYISFGTPIPKSLLNKQ